MPKPQGIPEHSDLRQLPGNVQGEWGDVVRQPKHQEEHYQDDEHARGALPGSDGLGTAVGVDPLKLLVAECLTDADVANGEDCSGDDEDDQKGRNAECEAVVVIHPFFHAEAQTLEMGQRDLIDFSDKKQWRHNGSGHDPN